MPVSLDWLVEGEVIYHHWWGVGTIEDVRYVNERTLAMYAQHPDRPLIHTIANSIDQSKNTASFSETRTEYTGLDHDQTGWILLVGANPIVRFAANIILQIGRKDKARIRMVASMDEAIDWLTKMDSTINWDAANWSVVERLKAEAGVKA